MKRKVLLVSCAALLSLGYPILTGLLLARLLLPIGGIVTLSIIMPFLLFRYTGIDKVPERRSDWAGMAMLSLLSWIPVSGINGGNLGRVLLSTLVMMVASTIAYELLRTIIEWEARAALGSRKNPRKRIAA